MDGIDLKPIKMNELINFDDIGRFVTEGMRAVSELKKQRTGKTSKQSTQRGTRQNSSLWRRADGDDGLVYGIKCKFKALISASGHVGPIVMHFYGFKESELSKDFVVLEVPGLCIGGEVIPGRRDVGYFLLSRGEASDDSGISMTEQIMEWYHNTIVLPFIAAVRATDTDDASFMSIEEDIEEDRDMDDGYTVLKLDSEISYLNCLKRPEVQEMNHAKRVVIVKIGGAATESYQPSRWTTFVGIAFHERNRREDCSREHSREFSIKILSQVGF